MILKCKDVLTDVYIFLQWIKAGKYLLFGLVDSYIYVEKKGKQ